MSDYNIEFKTLGSGDDTGRFSSVNSASHVRANLAGTATGSWASALAAAAYTGVPAALVFYNAGTDAIAVAMSDDADPTGYHVVAPGTQREMRFNAAVALKVKTV